MSKEYHKPQTSEISGDENEISAIVHEYLKDNALRYIKLELESEGTRFYQGKLTVRY